MLKDEDSGKKTQTIVLSPDVKLMLRAQAKRIGISMSSYIERLILEKEWEYEHVQEKEVSNG